jgi:hypothetical protein
VGGTQSPQSSEEFIALIMKGHISTGEMTDRQILTGGDAGAEVTRQYQIMTIIAFR